MELEDEGEKLKKLMIMFAFAVQAYWASPDDTTTQLVGDASEDLARFVKGIADDRDTLKIERDYRPRMDDYERLLDQVEKYQSALVRITETPKRYSSSRTFTCGEGHADCIAIAEKVLKE